MGSNGLLKNYFGLLPFIVVLLSAGIGLAQTNNGQAAQSQGVAFSGVVPYTGNLQDVLGEVASGKTIPVSSFSFTASKDGQTYEDAVVGASPFAGTYATTTINVVIVPVIVNIGGVAFDPTASDSCIVPAMSPLTAFQQSPVFQSVVFDGGAQSGHAATMNGVNVGTTTYPDAFRLAEFWTQLGGTNYHTLFNVTTASPWTISAAEVLALGGGNVIRTACDPIGVLNTDNLDAYIENTVIPGVSTVTPTAFALVLLKDIATTNASELNCADGCRVGFHGAQGVPVQTYMVAEYDTTQKFWLQSGIKNIQVLAHEVNKWLDDPLGLNRTPAWGNIGEEAGCEANWENGNPLFATDFPAITMPNGVNYDPQEAAFWSWFYNSQDTPSIGAGGKFSSNRSFAGPSKPCLPGGSY